MDGNLAIINRSDNDWDNFDPYVDELWSSMPGYEGLYEVSSFGNVRSLDRVVKTFKGEREYKGKTLKSTIGGKVGYPVYVLSKSGKTKMFRAHILVAITFLGHKPDGFKKVIDHVDNNKLNNNIYNLQIVSHRKNISKGKKRDSENTGVCWHKRHKKYICSISHNKKLIHLGYFNDKDEAKKVRKNYMLKHNL